MSLEISNPQCDEVTTLLDVDHERKSENQFSEPLRPQAELLRKEKNKKYMSSYMKKRYVEDPNKYKNYKNNFNIKKKYNVSTEQSLTWNENLYNIIKIKEIIDILPDGLFEKFLIQNKNGNLKFQLTLPS